VGVVADGVKVCADRVRICAVCLYGLLLWLFEYIRVD